MPVSEIQKISEHDRDAILKIIVAETYPRTVKEIRKKLRHSGHKFPEYLITRSLRSLLSEGKVRFKGGRWMSNELSEQIKTIQTGTPLNHVEIPKLSDAGQKAVKSVNGQFSQSSTPSESSTPTSVSQSGTWGKFRDVISYYIECLQNEEGADASAFIDDIGKQYVFTSGLGNWHPKTGERWSYAIPLGLHIEEFNRNLIRNSLDNKVVLGYPIEAISIKRKDGPDTRLIRPVFQYILEKEYNDNAIILSTSEAQPEISLEWMKYSLSNYSEQFHFLSHCGLINQPRPDDEPIGFTSEDIRPDLDELVSRLASFMPRNIIEQLNCRSVNADPLPSGFKKGIYNKAVIMIGNRTKYTQTLIKELELIKSQSDETLSTTSLRSLFINDADEKTRNEKNHEETVADVLNLNNEQREAVSSLLTNNLSVVTGPPGTGKSQVVMGAVANSRLRDKSVLFTSRNHKAIDAVVNRLYDDNKNPLIIRTNSKEDPSLKNSFGDAISKLQSDNIDVEIEKKYNRQRSKLDRLLIKRGEHAVVLDQIQSLRDKLGELEEDISYLEEEFSKELLSSLADSYIHISSKNIKDIQRLIDFINNNQKQIGFINYFFKWLGILRLWITTSRLINKVHNKSIIDKYPPISVKNLPEEKIIKQLEDINNYIDWKLQLSPLEDEIKELPPPGELVEEVKEISEQISKISSELLTLHSQSHGGLPEDGPYRENIKSLSNALKKMNKGFDSNEQREEIESRLREYIPILLNNFPAWAVTNLSVGSRIPLAPAIFDLAIVDEASQCDIASAIPVLYRAKRAAVVGDPNQLQHVSTLTVSRDSLIRKRVGLVDLDDMLYSYRETSLYDLFANNNRISPHLLRETYRSVGAIAEYSNSVFYNGMLRVATDENKLRIPKGSKSGIHWTKIEGSVVSAGKSGCVSEKEVEAVYGIVKNILVENNFKGSLGIVTPFRQQQKRLHDRIFDSDIPFDKLSQAQLNVDTAHGFQGDEKDVMIFSLCAGSDMPRGSLHFITNSANLFNVAVSRARSVLHVVGNHDWAQRSGIKHIVQLTQTGEKKSSSAHAGPWAPHESPWEKVLYDALLKKDIKCIPQYPVSGRRLDLALVSKNIKIDIEVDSDRYHRNPDGSRKKDDTWRDIYLMGMGWKVMRFWVYNLRDNMEKCVSEIEKVWRNHE